MPHLIRDVAEEVLKDFFFSNVIGHETGEEPEKFFDLKEEKTIRFSTGRISVLRNPGPDEKNASALFTIEYLHAPYFTFGMRDMPITGWIMIPVPEGPAGSQENKKRRASSYRESAESFSIRRSTCCTAVPV